MALILAIENVILTTSLVMLPQLYCSFQIYVLISVLCVILYYGSCFENALLCSFQGLRVSAR